MDGCAPTKGRTGRRTALSRLAAFVCLVLAVTQTACKKEEKPEPDDLGQGMAYLKAGLFGPAIVSLSAHLRRHPKDTEAFADRAIARTAFGDFDGAFGDYEAALAVDPGFIRAYMQRGMLRKKKGNPKGALEDFTSAIDFDPKNALAHYYRANIFTDAGNLDPALADYTSALQIEPKSALFHFNRGIAYYLRKDWEKAREDFDAAATQKEPQPYGRLYAHVLQLRLGKSAGARDGLRDGVAGLAESKPGEWFLALAGFLLGDIDEAALLAAAENGGSSQVRDQRCEAMYFAGMARLLAGQPAEATERFRQSIATRKSNLAEHLFAKAELRTLEATPEPEPQAEPPKPKPAAPQPVRGRLSAVGKRSISMRDRETGSTRSFAVTVDTKVTINGATASFTRLKAAMEAEVIVGANGAARSIAATGRK